MVGSSKILTVSYGTFSCTLEGFDHPFEAMKSIAEYFRDLAADDRYFGAEPPQPDAQMLHRIAEREVHRRVESRVETNGVVLRQAADAMPTGGSNDRPPRDRPHSGCAPHRVGDDQTVRRSSDDRRPSDKAPPSNAPFDVDIDGDSVAAKLARIRAVVARARATRDADTAFAEDEPVEDYLTAAPRESFADIGDPGADPEPDEVLATQTARDDDSEPYLTTASIIDALSDETDDADDYVRALDTGDAKGDAFAPSQADEQARPQQAGQADVQARALTETETTTEKQSLADPGAKGDAKVSPEKPRARVIKLKRTEFEAALAAGDIEEVDDTDDGDTIAEIDVEDDEAAQGEASHVAASPEVAITETATAQDRDDCRDANDVENLFADTDTDLVDDDDKALSAGIRNLIGGSSLSEGDQQDLLDELADIERDASTESCDPEAHRIRSKIDDLSDAEDDVDDAEVVEQTARQGEKALNRLLDETNAKLSDSEGTRRRSAIAHLKAAVAATRADIKARGGRSDPEKAESLNRYRDDLDKVVRPRRPGSDAKNTTPTRARPTDALASRPAPLMLVSELRVDEPGADTRSTGLVRPGRVAPSPRLGGANQVSDTVETSPTDRICFADFAAARGASTLDDKLEAAALYIFEVEGRNTMSRPELLRRAASLSPDSDIGREQGLQSFGALLRNGRIRKLGNGMFALVETAQDETPEAETRPDVSAKRYAGE